MPETVAHSLPGLFSCEARLTAYLNDAQNVRTGIRNDSLLGLLLTDGDVCYGLKAVDRISFELKLHNRPLPYKSSRLRPGPPAPGQPFRFGTTICTGRDKYATLRKGLSAPWAPGSLQAKQLPQQTPQTSGRTYHDDAHKKASPPA